MFEGWMPGRKPEIGGGDLESVTKLEALESRRNNLMTWMRRDSTTEDARILDDLNRQIQALEEQPNIRE